MERLNAPTVFSMMHEQNMSLTTSTLLQIVGAGEGFKSSLKV